MTHIDNVFFKEICNTLNNSIQNWGEAYRILKGQENGKPNKCVIVEVNGQNYLQVDSAPFISFHELFPRTKYQKPIYHCSPNKDGAYSLFKNGVDIFKHEVLTCDMLMNEIFGDIDIKLQNRKDVAKLIGHCMKRYINPNELGYDVSDDTYHFLDWNKTRGTEYLWFCNHFRDLKNFVNQSVPFDNCHVAKYTSLDTALMMLNSGKMRMMSVTAMNDRKEIGHLYGDLLKDNTDYLIKKTIVHFARQRYITSFTNKIDDLTMWRLYGDNGKGVCLIFLEPDACNYYFPVDYSGRNSDICLSVNEIYKKLSSQGVRFTFKSLKTIWQYFLKPEGFSGEQELRYLRIDNSKPDGYSLATNGVISTYKDYSIIDEQSENNFPARLQGIILGPNMKNAEINKFQLEALAAEKGIFLFKGVQNSSINYYL